MANRSKGVADAEQDSSVHVAFVCDGHYAMPLAAALASVQASLHAYRRLAVHVLEAGFSPALRKRVAASLARDRGEVHWHAMDVEHFAGLRTTLRSFDQISLVSYFRLLLAHCLPRHVPKVIYLDCDLVVESDLTRLWHEDLAGRLLAAVPETALGAAYAGAPAGIRLHRELGLPPDTALFNAGVMVLDLVRWRAEHVAERCLSYLQAAGNEVLWHDQEALNVVAAGDWTPLDPRWNVMMHAYRGGRAHGASEELRRDPWILHFNSARKPWHPEFSLGCADRFFRHLDRTSWAGWRPSPALLSRRLAAAGRRALLKRADRARRVVRRLAAALRASVAERRVLGPRLRLLCGTPVPDGVGEIRALLLLDDPSVCSVAADALFASGVHRVIAAAPEPVPGTAPRSLHVYRWNPARHSPEEMLLRLLQTFGDGCWCLLLESPGALAVLPDTAGPYGICDMARQVAQLESKQAEGLLTAPEVKAESLLHIEGFGVDLLTRRLLRGTTLVEPQSGRAAGRLVLLKWRGGGRVAADFSTAPGIRIVRLPARLAPHPTLF